MVETLKGLVQSMTGSSLASKHEKVGITVTANTSSKMNNVLLSFLNEIFLPFPLYFFCKKK